MLAAEKIKRLNRLYAVASGINEAIVRIPGEAQLFLEACRIAVERGGFTLAWVGIEDPAAHRLVPAARWGRDDGYIDSIVIRTDAASIEGLGPAGRAFRTGETAVCNDIESDTLAFAFRSEALAHGLRSCAAFPLTVAGRQQGVFIVYASEPLYFDDEELALLASLAGNFSFAVEARQREAGRERIESALRTSEARLRAIVENEPECVKILGAEGTVLDMNPAGLAMMEALSIDEVRGRSVLDFVHPDDREAYRALHARVMRGERARMQARAVGLHGRLLWMDAHAVPLRDDHGAVVNVLCVTRDVTEQRAALDRLEQEQREVLRLNAELEHRVRQRTAQLESANHELEAFSYSVAHDLRAPLMAIGGFSQALEGALPQGAGDRVGHFLSRIREGVQRTSEMIDALLSLAQVSRTDLRWEDVDLSVLAQRAAEHCHARMPGHAMRVDIQPGMTARGDPRLLQLVFDNLLSNAWKFTGPTADAAVTVSVQTGPQGEATYEVRDNGVGFDMAYYDHLFGTFQRLHRADEFPGNGIGLANVRRIVARHNGRVWAHSRPGEGAAFFFTLGDCES